MTTDAAAHRRGSPFFARAAEARTSDLLYEWSSQLVVWVYSDVERELRAIRETVSMNDMSPLSKVQIDGSDAPAFVSRLLTRDTSALAVGHAMYSPWCNDAGKLVGDGLVFRHGGHRFVISAGPSIDWFAHVAAGLDVALDDVSDDWAILAVQGPRSTELLDCLSGDSLGGLPFSRRRSTTIAGVPVDVARQGFTGERGYELWVPSPDAPRVWDAVLADGEELGIEPAGERAIDVARVEAGLILMSAEYTSAGADHATVVSGLEGGLLSPRSVGLDQLIDLDGSEFVGRDALRAEAERGGPDAQLVGLQLDWRALSALYEQSGRPAAVNTEVSWVPLELRAGGKTVGRATSVTWSPTCSALIGFGTLPSTLAQVGDTVAVAWTADGVDGEVPAAVVDLPFIRLRRSS